MKPLLLDTLPAALWRGSQLARPLARCLPAGHPGLDAELPGGGWPLGSLTELLLDTPGIGEWKLLRPALQRAGPGLALVQPPHLPQPDAWPQAPSPWLCLRPAHDSDALWAAEQILRSRCFGALLLWQARSSPAALRRLHLAAQAGDTLFLMLRPLSCASQPSPAPLRLGLRPAPGGLSLQLLKRRGPPREAPIHLPLHPHASSRPAAALDRRAPVPA